MVRSYVEVFDPPATTVDGVKLALSVGGTWADACPTKIVRRASENQAVQGTLKPIIGTSQKCSLWMKSHRYS
jgi:hypothetical protein